MSDTEETTQLPDSENPHAAEFAVLDALQKENAELKDARLRALAEVENVRRIAAREKSEASQYAVTKFARDMLGIADNFARALAAVPADVRAAADAQIKAVLDGVSEVEVSLSSLARTSERVAALETACGGAERRLGTQATLQGLGLSSRFDRLDLQRQQLQLQSELAAARHARSTAFVALYKALGGAPLPEGWVDLPDMPGRGAGGRS